MSCESSTTALAFSELHFFFFFFCKEEMLTTKLGQICCSGLNKITKAKACCAKNYRTHETSRDHLLHPSPSQGLDVPRETSAFATMLGLKMMVLDVPASEMW